MSHALDAPCGTCRVFAKKSGHTLPKYMMPHTPIGRLAIQGKYETRLLSIRTVAGNTFPVFWLKADSGPADDLYYAYRKYYDSGVEVETFYKLEELLKLLGAVVSDNKAKMNPVPFAFPVPFCLPHLTT